MNRQAKLEIARRNHAAFRKAEIENLFRGGADPRNDAARYGYRSGWFYVGETAFSVEEITGQGYDITQGGWAHL